MLNRNKRDFPPILECEDPKRLKTVATQTSPLGDKHMERRTDIQSNNFLSKLKEFLLELFESEVLRESRSTQALLIENALQHSFRSKEDPQRLEINQEGTGNDSDASTISGGVISEDTSDKNEVDHLPSQILSSKLGANTRNNVGRKRKRNGNNKDKKARKKAKGKGTS